MHRVDRIGVRNQLLKIRLVSKDKQSCPVALAKRLLARLKESRIRVWRCQFISLHIKAVRGVWYTPHFSHNPSNLSGKPQCDRRSRGVKCSIPVHSRER